MNRLRRLRLPAALFALVAALSLLAAGCGEEEAKTSGAEGEFIEVGNDVTYQVQNTRLLNPQQRPDDSYLRAQAVPTRDEAYLGVFVKIENDGDEPYKPPRDITLVDTVGTEYLPLDTIQSGFGLDLGQEIEPGGVAPPPNSPAQFGPTSGALLLYKVKQETVTDNLPLELRIPVEGSEQPAIITLDV